MVREAGSVGSAWRRKPSCVPAVVLLWETEAGSRGQAVCVAWSCVAVVHCLELFARERGVGGNQGRLSKQMGVTAAKLQVASLCSEGRWGGRASCPGRARVGRVRWIVRLMSL